MDVRRAPLRKVALGALFSGVVSAAGAPPAGQPAVAELPVAAAPVAATLTPAAADSHYTKIPLHFEKNQGQSAAAVQYLARGAGYTLFLTPDEAVLRLQQAPTDSQRGSAHTQPAPVQAAVLRAQLVDANRSAPVIGEDEQSDRANYLIGRDPSKWQRNVAEFSRVRYSNLYDGIDLVYYGNQQQLEYDFVVAPGADPDRIHLRYEGVKTASVDAQGELHLDTGDGEVVEHKPVIYQVVQGERRPVEGAFRLSRHDDATADVAFTVASYDKSLPLTVDPVLAYSTYLGGSFYDRCRAIAVDTAGSAYVTGYAASADFPTTVGAYKTTLGTAYSNAFVSKLKPDGSGLVYSTYLGGSQGDSGNGIAVDQMGLAYITGSTNSDDFPVTPNAFQTQLYTHQGEAFVSALSADGSKLVYSTFLDGGDGGYSYGGAIAVDRQNGGVYVTGETGSFDFPLSGDAFQSRHASVFVSKLDTVDGWLLYSTYLGGTLPGPDYGNGIAVDGNGNAYIVGQAGTTDFPVTQGAFQTTLAAPSNAFVAKLNSLGTGLVYSTYLGGTGGADDQGNAIAVGADGSAYVTGLDESSDFPVTLGAYQTTGSYDAFVTRVNPTGTGLIYSTHLGGEAVMGDGIAVDSQGNAYVTGELWSYTSFPITTGAFQTQRGDSDDAFITVFTPDGSNLVYSSYLGGSDSDVGRGIAVDSHGAAYVAGETSSPGSSFPTSPGAFQNHQAGLQNGFVAKIVNMALSPTTLYFGGVTIHHASNPMAVTLTNNLSTAVVLKSITTTMAAYSRTTTCGSSLVPGASCTITVTFTPGAVGAYNATLKLVTSAGTLGVALTGNGVAPAPVVSLSTTSLDFATVSVGTTSRPKQVTLTNSGTAALKISSIVTSNGSGGEVVPAIGEGFLDTTSCPATLKIGASCVIRVTFSPSQAGAANGTVAINSNAATSPDTIYLSGSGH